MEPIKAGDNAIIVAGFSRHKSPNIGKTVKVISLVGDHSQYGRTWRCTGDIIYQMDDSGNFVNVGWADIPAAWLQKMPPSTPPAKAIEQDVILQA